MRIQNIKNIRHIRQLFNQPDVFFFKLKKKVCIACNEFFIDLSTRQFIEHNKKVWKGWGSPQSDKVILVEFNNLVDNNVSIFYFMNVLARKKEAKIVSFGKRQSRFARGVHAVYRSANVSGHIFTDALNGEQRQRADLLFKDIARTVKDKKDVFNITVEGVHIGIDIYETYLKEFNKPTVLLDDALFSTIQLAVDLFVFWQDYFEKHEVCGVILSHDCYVDYNIIAKVAYQRQVPVYLPDFFQVIYAQRPFSVTSRFKNYKTWFQELDVPEQERAMALAQRQLEKRFSGQAEGDILYGASSAFILSKKQEDVLRASNKTKVLICSHCFYDNPHAYGGMIFSDFYEWLQFLVEIAKKTDYDWYLKTHPDPLPGTEEIIREILGKDPLITIIPSSTAHPQLVKEGLDFVLTAYGTVGHEYPVFDVQVVNAGYNPHADYDFTWTPRNLEEYEKYLMNLPRLKKTINKEEIYQFYFMHHYYCRIDDLVYDSYRKLASELTLQERISSKVYGYFLKYWTLPKHERIIQQFSDFIDSRKQYLFLKGPVDSTVPSEDAHA